MNELGEFIRDARDRLKLQAYEVSNAVGLSPSWFSRLEAGKVANTPPPAVLRGLAKTLDVTQADMLARLGYDVGLPTPVEGSEEIEHLVATVRSLDDEQLLNLRRFLRYLTEAPDRTMRVPPVARQSR